MKMSNYIEVTPSEVSDTKYAPLTSVNVEYILSQYELTLKSNCRTLKFENL
jgi:hypothetical protein